MSESLLNELIDALCDSPYQTSGVIRSCMMRAYELGEVRSALRPR